MKKILEKSGKSQGISSEEKSGNPDLFRENRRKVWTKLPDFCYFLFGFQIFNLVYNMFQTARTGILHSDLISQLPVLSEHCVEHKRRLSVATTVLTHNCIPSFIIYREKIRCLIFVISHSLCNKE